MRDNTTEGIKAINMSGTSGASEKEAFNFIEAIMRHINSSKNEHYSINTDEFIEQINDNIISEKLDIECEIASLRDEVGNPEICTDESVSVINLMDFLCTFIPDELREAESFSWMNEKEHNNDRMYNEKLLRVYCNIDNRKLCTEYISDYYKAVDGSVYGITYEAKAVLDFMRYIYKYAGVKRTTAYGVSVVASILFMTDKELCDIIDVEITQIAVDISNYLNEYEYVSSLIAALINIIQDIKHTENLAKSVTIPEHDLCRIRESYNIKMVDNFGPVVNKGESKKYTDFEVCCFLNIKDNNEVYGDSELRIQSDRVERIANSISNMLCKVNNNMLIYVGENHSEYYDAIKGAWQLLVDRGVLYEMNLDSGPLMEVDPLFLAV